MITPLTVLYFLRPKHILHSIDSFYNLPSKRLVTTSVSLYTQTRSPCLTFQFINTRACFIDLWYTSLTSVHYNLGHGLAIVTESFSPLNLDYTTSLVKVWIRSDLTSLILFTCPTTCKNQFELVTASLNHVLSVRKHSTPWPLLEFPIFPPDGL